MASLPDNFTITSAGTFDHSPLNTGSKYALEFIQATGGIFPSSIEVQFPNGPDGAYITPENATFTTDSRSARFVAPDRKIRFVVSGDPGAFQVSLTEFR